MFISEEYGRKTLNAD